MKKAVFGRMWVWLFLIGLVAGNTAVSLAKRESVQICDQGTYYQVVINFSKKPNHKRIGTEYGRQLKKQAPGFEAVIDSYLAEISQNNDVYQMMLARAADLKLRLPREYQDEIAGLAAELSSCAENIRGDNKLSPDELLLFNLTPDVFRATQCSVLAVFGARSATHKTMLARMLDYYGGTQNQLPKIQAVTYIRYTDKRLCLIGYLGYFGVISGFNDHQVFAAIMDSATGVKYTSQGKCSYPMDLRFALENKTTLNDVAEYMSDPAKNYTFNHLIALADPQECKILENNISGTGTDMRRALRSFDSPLNDGIAWDINDAVGSVNSFLLKGNHDNHTGNLENTARWAKMKEQLLAQGDIITLAQLKKVISFHNGPEPGLRTTGDLYNVRTQQIIVLEPDSLSLEVFFRPGNSLKLPPDPVFEKVQSNP
jgi:hypothetical protein